MVLFCFITGHLDYKKGKPKMNASMTNLDCNRGPLPRKGAFMPHLILDGIVTRTFKITWQEAISDLMEAKLRL